MAGFLLSDVAGAGTALSECTLLIDGAPHEIGLLLPDAPALSAADLQGGSAGPGEAKSPTAGGTQPDPLLPQEASALLPAVHPLHVAAQTVSALPYAHAVSPSAAAVLVALAAAAAAAREQPLVLLPISTHMSA